MRKQQLQHARWLAAMSASFLLLIFMSLSARAQEAGGSLVGVVSDPSGADIANANVSARNVATSTTRTGVTNSSGLYSIPDLIPGTYEVTVTAPGFSTSVVSDVGLLAGERREVNVSMTIGAVTQQVTVVSSAVADVQLATSEVRGVIDEHTVVELPLNGRDWTSLTLLEPGVAQIRTQKTIAVSNDRANRGLGVDVSIGGNRPQGNNYQLDGVSINDYSSGAPGSITGAVLGVDAVQEFTVITSDAPADYGKTSGGVINAASRSGTNAFHGSVYEFLRNAAIQTRNYFDGPTVPPFKRNQFGASGGGPIIKNRTFFFADYEGFRQSLSQPNTITVPSVAAKSGNLVAGPVTIDPKVAPFLSLFPNPNGTVTGDTGVFTFIGKQITSENFVTARVDHRISNSDNLFVTYLYDTGNVTTPDSYDIKNIGNSSGRQTLAVEESHVFKPTLLNTVGVGFNRNVVDAFKTLSAINPAASNIALGFNPGEPVGVITVGSGVTQFPGGIGAISEYRFHYNSYQAHDNIVWTLNKHSLKLGFYTERIQSNQFTQGASPNGFYTFGGLKQFLLNQPTTFQTLLSASKTPRDLRQTIYSGYVQDDYKFKPNLTINLGLRYEMATVPTETAGQLSTLIHYTDTTPHLGSPYFSNPTLRNFAPRVGFAWDPFKKGTTSVRGAFGIYDVLPLPYEFELLTLLSAPYTEGASTPVVAGDFPTNGYVKANNPTNLREAYVQQNPGRSYVEQWTLNVQHEVFSNFTMTLGYVGSHGVHLPFHADEINDVQPTLTSIGYMWPGPGVTGVRLFPNIGGQVSTTMWVATSSYNGLNLSAVKRLSHGFQIQGSYTFSKSIDTGSSGIAGDTFGNSVSSLPTFDSRLRRGLSDFDVRHVLAVNAIWMVPGAKEWGSVGDYLSSGWQIGGIYTVASGLPFTPVLGGDPLGLKGADLYAFPNRVPGCNPVNSNFKQNNLNYINLTCFTLPTAPASFASMCNGFSGATTPPPAGQVYCSNLLGNSGRNTVIGPGLQDLDFSLFKNNPIRRISETFNAQFRWEVFNIANHANFNPPLPGARQIFSATGVPNANPGMLATPTTQPSRQMQFALKLIW